jgi:hypothetical protein
MLGLLDFENAILDLFEDNRIPVQDRIMDHSNGYPGR